jgi:tetratricopeptide (TPR) repeat protein
MADFDQDGWPEPTQGQAEFRRGRVLRGLGRFAEAAASLRRAAVLTPHAAVIHLTLAETLLESGDPAGAREALATAARLGTADPARIELIRKKIGSAPLAPPPRPKSGRAGTTPPCPISPSHSAGFA